MVNFIQITKLSSYFEYFTLHNKEAGDLKLSPIQIGVGGGPSKGPPHTRTPFAA